MLPRWVRVEPELPFSSSAELVAARASVGAVNSSEPAEIFEKDHRNVLRDIDGLLGYSDLRSLREQGVSPFDPKANKAVRSFDMTRDGFTLLATGIGERAMTFKVRCATRGNAPRTRRADVPPSFADSRRR
jgi:Rha family phage regulatory protein